MRASGCKWVLSVSVMAVTALHVSSAIAGEVRMLQWVGGAGAEMYDKLIETFEAANPGITVTEVAVTFQGDQRNGIRTALFGGQTADLLPNAWPAFRDELSDAGFLTSLSEAWEQYGWDNALNDGFRELGTSHGDVYGAVYTYGFRSGIWYRPAGLESKGVGGFPATWEEFSSSFGTLRETGSVAPVAFPAKVWAHAEWFETLMLRTAGSETMGKLARHEIEWTDPAVITAMEYLSDMHTSGCCDKPDVMLASGGGDMRARVFEQKDADYLLMGMWTNSALKKEYGLTAGEDYNVAMFPALGMGHDSASMIDTNELLVLSNGSNTEEALKFIDFMLSAEGGAIIAEFGRNAATSKVDTSLYGPVVGAASQAVESASELQFVLGDLLPGDLVDEYRVQLQKFVANPTKDNILPTLEAIEVVADRSY